MNAFRNAVVWILILFSPSLYSQDPDFQDWVDTLPLTSRLDCRGNLGGVAVDRLGFVYVANFRDAVWKISPEGEVQTLTRGLYGASGNAIDSHGDLFQSNFYGNTITRITRNGDVTEFTREGLSGPVGIAIDRAGNLFVCNCTGNTLSKIAPDGRARPFASSPDFACPNGITFDDQGIEAATAVYQRYKADPARKGENTAAEVISLGYRLLSSRKAAEALELLRLNALSYSQLPAAQYHLGEAFRYTGQNELAIQQYRRVLELDPEHSQAASRLQSLESK